MNLTLRNPDKLLMRKLGGTSFDLILFLATIFLMSLGFIVLRSVAPTIYPLYFLFIILAFASFIIFLQIEFEVLELFSKHLYVVSIFLLILPLVFGQVTRGAIRWIPLGPITIQPSEVVRPFLLLFFASFLTSRELNAKRLVIALFLLALPFFLILVQPSLGVAVLTLVGFLGVLLASSLKKQYIASGILVFLVLIPIFWLFLAPYQKSRLSSFLDLSSDPRGAGYNSIQAMISVGSGRLTGRGLGEGVQTQLRFLPEKHTDFIFAATAEELGLVGAIFLIAALFIVLFRLTKIIENARSPTGRAYVSGFFLVLLAETVIHIGMNVGILPVTGIPLPLVSAGGSSLLATMTGLAIAINVRKRSSA